MGRESYGFAALHENVVPSVDRVSPSVHRPLRSPAVVVASQEVTEGPASADDIGELDRAELEEHARALRAVVSVADAVHLSTDFADLAERAVDAIVTYTRYPSVGLFRVNRGEQRLELVAIRGFGPEVTRSAQTLPLEGSLTGVAVREKAVVTSHDLARDGRLEPRTKTALEHEGFVEVASVPLLFQDEAIGALNLIYKHTADLSPHERSILLAIGQTIGIAMHNRIAAEERRALDERLRRAEQLENLGVLAGGIAHDFNNLLMAIMGAISLTRGSVADPELRTLLEEAENGCRRASALVRQLLTFSRGGAPLKRATENVAAIVRDAAEFVLHGRDIVCEVQAADEIGTIEIDPTQLAQVVQNLVLNAAQASAPGKRVVVKLERREHDTPAPPLEKGPYLALSVKDEGSGIPADRLSRIFDPYFTTRPAGSGIGLATTHSIVTRHGGRIWVDSDVGKGSTFHVEIPIEESRVQAPSSDQDATIPTDLRVLVVDDEPAVRHVLGRMLSRHGSNVGEASNATEAVARFAQAKETGKPFDLVILDLTLVGSEGGVQILQHLRSLQEDVRVVVSSGYSEDAAMSQHSKLGFAAVLPKPYTFRELDKALVTALSWAG